MQCYTVTQFKNYNLYFMVCTLCFMVSMLSSNILWTSVLVFSSGLEEGQEMGLLLVIYDWDQWNFVEDVTLAVVAWFGGISIGRYSV